MLITVLTFFSLTLSFSLSLSLGNVSFVFVFLYSTDLDGAVICRQGWGLGGVVVAIHSSLMKQQLLIRNGDGEHAV